MIFGLLRQLVVFAAFFFGLQVAFEMLIQGQAFSNELIRGIGYATAVATSVYAAVVIFLNQRKKKSGSDT